MSKIKKSALKEKIFSQIKKGEVTMRPRAYFVVGSLLSALGLLITSSVLVFSLYLARFALTHPGPGAKIKLSLLLSSLPWYIPVSALGSIILGYYLLRRYDFSYRKNFLVILLIILAGLYLGSVALERSRIEEFLTTRGYLRRFEQNFPGQGRGVGRFR